MKRSRVPKQLKVGGVNYKLLYPYTFISNPILLGLHEGDQACIKITAAYQNLPRSWAKIGENILHELIHAVDHIYCGVVLQEEEVHQMSNYLFQVVRDNELNIKKGKLPEFVKIGGFNYEVIGDFEFKDGDECAGAIEHELMAILMSNRDSQGQEYAPAVKMTNFLYLMTCAICEQTTIPRGFKHGEKLGDGMSNHQSFASGIHQIFVDNDLEKLLKSDGELK